MIALDKYGAISYYKSMKTPISKSQTRAMKLAGLATVDSYEVAATALETAGYRKDGIPQGHNWRTAAKLTDGDTFIPSPEQHNCEYALSGCKGSSEGRRVRSAHGREAWACTECAAKLDRYRPFQRLTSVEAIERGV